MPISGYLTINDCPSHNFSEKVTYLNNHNLKALLFCTGNLITRERELELIDAIKKGFIIGNHSWSHYDFTILSSEEIHREVVQTDRLISSLYRRAGVKQRAKYFRFPYLKKSKKAEELLNELGYQSDIDMNNPIDTGDWDKFNSLKDILGGIEDLVFSDQKTNIILMHDFDHNQDYFPPMIEKLMECGVSFDNCYL